MSQTCGERESWKAPDEAVSAELADGSSDLMESVLHETDAVGEPWEFDQTPDEVDLAVFASTARQLKQRQASPDEAIRELVRLAIPDELAPLFCSAAAWHAACTAVACRLAEDATARPRILALWERMAEGEGHEEEH